MKKILLPVAAYLDKVRVPMRIGCTTESSWPVVLSLWFTHRDGKLYCATQESARVVSYLRANPKCAFEIAADTPPYCGVRGQALASVDKTLGPEILEELIYRYLGEKENPLARKLLDKLETEVAIILKPVNYFSWDYSSRMQKIAPSMLVLAEKSCP